MTDSQSPALSANPRQLMVADTERLCGFAWLLALDSGSFMSRLPRDVVDLVDQRLRSENQGLPWPRAPAGVLDDETGEIFYRQESYVVCRAACDDDVRTLRGCDPVLIRSAVLAPGPGRLPLSAMAWAATYGRFDGGCCVSRLCWLTLAAVGCSAGGWGGGAKRNVSDPRCFLLF